MDIFELLTRFLLFLFLLWWFFTQFLPQIIDFLFDTLREGQPALLFLLTKII
ncbi:MAG: hypothetical protein ACLFVP_07140 [Candidatus Bathyarchaeia archaeon]